MDIELILENILKNNRTHACWLNNLAYMEYRGFRKIIRSCRTEEVTQEILQHIQEEVRHAVLLKKLAIKVGGDDFNCFTDKTMLKAFYFKKYFYELDTTITQLRPENNYHAVSSAIEVRALKIYQSYEKLLRKNDLGISIQTIIDDEQKHLDHFMPKVGEEENRIRDIENKCFEDLCKGFSL